MLWEIRGTTRQPCTNRSLDWHPVSHFWLILGYGVHNGRVSQLAVINEQRGRWLAGIRVSRVAGVRVSWISGGSKGGSVDWLEAVRGGSVDSPEAERGGSVDSPKAVRGGSVDSPKAGRGGSVNSPEAERRGSVNSPEAVRGGSVDSPEAERGGSVDLAEAVRGGSVDSPEAVWGGSVDSQEAVRGGSVDLLPSRAEWGREVAVTIWIQFFSKQYRGAFNSKHTYTYRRSSLTQSVHVCLRLISYHKYAPIN